MHLEIYLSAQYQVRVYERVILQAERSAEDRTERYGPVQQHRRMVTSLNKQIQQKTKELEEVRLTHAHIVVYPGRLPCSLGFCLRFSFQLVSCVLF